MNDTVICHYCNKKYSKYGIKNHIQIVHLKIRNVDYNKGKKTGTCWNKGKTYIELYGEEKARIIKQKISNSALLKLNSGIALTPDLEEKRKKKISIGRKKYCKNISERIRLKEIGRKGGFGKKGYTEKGTYYQSNFEKNCFELLESNNIIFEAHKSIPNSSKVSDIYLPLKNIWIELDGINREKRKKWLGNDYNYWLEKLELYKKQNLNLKIFKTISEFKNFIDAGFP